MDDANASVLIADDDDGERFLVSTGGRQLGYNIVEAADGLLALAMLEEQGAPRIAILDWEMPGLTGPEVCRAVRARENMPYIYLILLTVRDELDDLREGLTAGADDYLVKPCHPAELQARIETGLRVIYSTDQLALTIGELNASNEMLAAFSRALAHDLRGAITSVAGYSHILQKSSAIRADDRYLLNQIVDATKRMTDMVDDVLVLETAKRQPERAIFDLREVITDAAADVNDIEVIFGQVPEQLIAHRSSVARSFKNLFENASRYARRANHDHVTVRVDSEEDSDSWTFLVEDDGPGIPVSDRERVFSTFVRGSNTEGMRGTGLGLSIVAACARAHDGEVTVTDGANGGARFRLILKKPVSSVSQ